MKIMKYAALVLLAVLMTYCSGAQKMANDTTDYKSLWQQVEKHQNDGKVRSALKVVDTIYASASKYENQPQWVKAIVYKQRLEAALVEEGAAININTLEQGIAEKPQPMRSILHHYAGVFYQQYIDQNQYRIRNRTFTAEDSEDIRSWSLERLEERSRFHFLQSTGTYYKDPITAWDVLIENNKEKDPVYKTLGDVLFVQATQYFKTHQNLHAPVDPFIVTDKDVMSPLDQFITASVATLDPSDYNYITLDIYKKWLKKLNNQDPLRSIIDADRLMLTHQLLRSEQKDAFYEQALKTAANQTNVACPYQFRLAQFYINQGNLASIEEQDSDHYVRAHKILNESRNTCTIKSIQNAIKGLVESLEQQEYQAVSREILPPSTDWVYSIQYRNVNKLYGFIYKIEPDDWNHNYYDNGTLRLPPSAKLIDQREINLPDDNDLKRHSVELIQNGLEKGQYVLFVSNTSTLKNHSKQYRLQPILFQVSNLSATNIRQQALNWVMVTDRVSGQPIANAEVTLYDIDYGRSRQQLNILRTLTTDKDGIIKSPVNERMRAQQFRVRKGDDLFIVGHGLYQNRIREGRLQYEVRYITDRSIYRPGQTVHFQGIVTSKDGNQPTIIRKGEKVNVVIRDVNNKELYSKTHTSDAYGVISGTFDIPSGVLTGNFSIRSNNIRGYARFSVEAYKRPRFETTFNDLDGNYVTGRDITIEGIAKNYAGNALQNAIVKYRVKRSTYFPYWRGIGGFQSCFPSFQQEQEVAHGLENTSEDGSFKINFKALGDPLVADRFRPQYGYTVEITVVDETGESHDYTQRLQVSQTAVSVRFDRSSFSLTTQDSVIIKTPNANAVAKDWSGRLKVQRLEHPETSYQKRPWGTPDRLIHREEDFSDRVPMHPLGDTLNSEKWSIAETVFDEKIKTSYRYALNSLSAGHYKISFSGKDTFNTPIDYFEIVSITDIQNGGLAYGDKLQSVLDKSSYAPGEKATLNIVSNDIQPVYVFIDRPYKNVKASWERVENKKAITIPISEEDIGGVHVLILGNKNGEQIIDRHTINVPWNNKDLKVEWTEIRKRLKPGVEQEWTFKITDHKGDPVDASVAATLYDASLDYFKNHNWAGHYFYNYANRTSTQFFGYDVSGYHQNGLYMYSGDYYLNYPRLKYGYEAYGNYYGGRVIADMAANDGVRMRKSTPGSPPAPEMEESATLDEVNVMAAQAAPARAEDGSGQDAENAAPPAVRKNLQELVYFSPQVITNEKGEASIDFKMGEALTKWKLLLKAHSKETQLGYQSYELETYKDFMAFPLFPRFLREGDKMVIRAKLVNLSDKDILLNTQLDIENPLQNNSVLSLFQVDSNSQIISVAAGQSEIVKFQITVPSVDKLSAARFRIISRGDGQADGEEIILPITTNRVQLHESLTLSSKGVGTTSYDLSRITALKNRGAFLQNITLEMTAHPAWNAVLALPYIDDNDHITTSALVNKYFGYALGQHIVNTFPRIEDIVNIWKSTGEDVHVFRSELEKNPELKDLLLSQTPWLLDAESEAEQRRRLSVFFDRNTLNTELATLWNKIKQRQQGSGGFSWTPESRASDHVTRELLELLGLLKDLGALDAPGADRVIQYGLNYSHAAADRIYQRSTKKNKDLPFSVLHYLYVRSLHPDVAVNVSPDDPLINYYIDVIKEKWNKHPLYSQGIMVAILKSRGEQDLAKYILASIKERALIHDEIGRYWKSENGYHFYARSLTTHTLLLNLFEQDNDEKFVAELKLWLLQHKRTNAWPSSRETVHAVHALLSSGDDWLTGKGRLETAINGTVISTDQGVPGLSYVKETVQMQDLPPMLDIKSTVESPSWSSIHWTYFEAYDKVDTYDDTPLKLSRQLLKITNTDRGPKGEIVQDGVSLQPGDHLVVRVKLTVDREMDFLHLSDHRASNLEPKQIMSGYKYQDGLSYYQSIKDSQADFFIEHARPGTYIFEYPLAVTHVGDFSGGLAKIQSFYAPEFSSHSEGTKIKVIE